MFAAVVLAGVLAHAPGMTHGGVVWDDDDLLFKNEMIKAEDGLEKFWLTDEAPDYLPLTWTSLWLEWRLWGDDPTGYHVTNVLMHAAAAGLLLALLRRLGVPGAFWAALIFAVHPVGVASVAWISERKNTLSILFYLGSLIAFVDFLKTDRPGKYALALLMFVLALLSKSSVVMLPVVLLLIAWWLWGRVPIRTALMTAPFFLLSLAASMATIRFQQQNVIADSPMPDFSVGQKIAQAGWILWFYIYKSLLPLRVTMIYERWNVDAGRVVSYLPTAAMLALLGWSWVARARIGRGVFFALAYFVVVLLPVLGFVPMFFHRFTLVSDHLQYLAMPAIVALAVGIVCSLLSRGGWSAPGADGRAKSSSDLGGLNTFAIAAGLIVVGVLGVLTARQSLAYQNLETMWRDVMAKTPSCPLAYFRAGMTESDRGNRHKALELFHRAIELDPEYSEAYNNAGQLIGADGDHARALEYFLKALRASPANTNALQSVVAAASLRPPQEGRWIVAEAASLIHDRPRQINNLAVLLIEGTPGVREPVRDPPLALQLALRAVELLGTEDRLSASFMDTLAGAYAHNGDLSAAIRTDEEALRLAGDDRETASLIRRNLSRYRMALAGQSQRAGGTSVIPPPDLPSFSGSP